MRIFPATAILATMTLSAAAQTPAQDREALISVYTITISQELCKFELTDDQADAVGKASDKLEEQLGLSDEDSQKLYDQVEADLVKQKAGGLCDPQGAWIKTYKKTLADLTK